MPSDSITGRLVGLLARFSLFNIGICLIYILKPEGAGIYISGKSLLGMV